jgi:Fic family protein
MKEAELSSRIEGTVATANEVYQREAGEEFEPEKTADIYEILNYRETLRLAEEEIKGREISQHLIRQMHEILMRGVRGEKKNPGRFRLTQNWIGPKNSPIEQASYVPPPPTSLPELMEGFSAFINSNDKDLDPIVQAALAHAQFEMIHPFDDGNGRIGRLLIPLLLTKRGSLVSPSLYLSSYLEAHRGAYYDALSAISTRGDWIGWISFFLEAVIVQANNNLSLVRQIIELYERTQRDVANLFRTDKAMLIVDLLFDTPVFRAADLHTRVGVNRQRANQYIQEMKKAGVVQEIRPGSGRRSGLISFDALWNITDQQ